MFLSRQVERSHFAPPISNVPLRCMQGSIKSILNGVVVIAVVLWLLNVFGLFHSLARIHIGT